jgi:hypothetical protein
MQSENTKIFREIFKSTIANNLSDYLFLALSNMLSIDFTLRQISKQIRPYALECASRIKSYLGDQKLESKDFADVLKLFSIAINENDDLKYIGPDSAKISVEDGLLVEQIINNCLQLSKLPDKDKSTAKNIIINLKARNKKISFDVLLENAKSITSKVNHFVTQSSIKKEQFTQEMLNLVNIQKQIDSNKDLLRKKSKSLIYK